MDEKIEAGQEKYTVQNLLSVAHAWGSESAGASHSTGNVYTVGPILLMVCGGSLRSVAINCAPSYCQGLCSEAKVALTSDQDSRKTLTPSKVAINWTLLS
jgi:hypothetical protein